MRNIGKLRAIGFTIAPTTDIVNCTDITHSEPFFYYRHKLVSAPDAILTSLCSAGVQKDGRYGFTLAGSFNDDGTDLPVTFMSDSDRSRAIAARDAANEARDVLRKLEDEFHMKIGEIMAGATFQSKTTPPASTNSN